MSGRGGPASWPDSPVEGRDASSWTALGSRGRRSRRRRRVTQGSAGKECGPRPLPSELHLAQQQEDRGHGGPESGVGAPEGELSPSEMPGAAAAWAGRSLRETRGDGLCGQERDGGGDPGSVSGKLVPLSSSGHHVQEAGRCWSAGLRRRRARCGTQRPGGKGLVWLLSVCLPPRLMRTSLLPAGLAAASLLATVTQKPAGGGFWECRQLAHTGQSKPSPKRQAVPGEKDGIKGWF